MVSTGDDAVVGDPVLSDQEVLRATRPTGVAATPLPVLAEWIGLTSRAEVAVTGLSLSSQRVLPGDLYAALPGARVHGATYARSALDAGAVAILTDEAGRVLLDDPGVPVLVVESPRTVLGRLAAHINGDPAAAMAMIGITGTQGKTTSTRLAESALESIGIPSAVVGTVGTRIRGEDLQTTLTTPEAPDLHAIFALMRERGVHTCAMEVSSHALVMGRVDGIVFDVAVFTNLGRDHLDFHDDVEDYFAAKASLFTPVRARLGLVNIDDEHGRRLVDGATIPMRTFALVDESADWRAIDVELAAEGSSFTVVGPGGVRVRTSVPIPGDFNVANALAAIASAAEVGHDPAAVAAGLAGGGGVPGRLERVEVGRGVSVIVDYAHKPDAVEATLRTLRPLTSGRVIVVLGAGGDRDTGKRPLMGEISARLADLTIVTDDNPRTEDPADIRAQVLAGAVGPGEVLEVAGRREAIRAALDRAEAGDIVLVAGKGHETGQEINGVVHPFDDRDVVREEAER
jgi:UDP-N-acetylmuramoyl-L-alanyl-D-glutamate--2,6-diaminopimelate ligase